MWNKRINLIVIILIMISLAIIISINLSYNYDPFQKISFVNYSILSQWFASFGTIYAVIFALCSDEIKKYLTQCKLIVTHNLDWDRNYDHNNNDIYFYFHLKILNKSKGIIAKNVVLKLLPQNIEDYCLDIYRPFHYGGDKSTSKDISSVDYIDYVNIEVSLYFRTIKLIYQTENYFPITINLTNNPQTSIKAVLTSPNLLKDKILYIKFEIDPKEIELLFDKWCPIRDDFIKSHNGYINDINEITNTFGFNDFYKHIKITVS